MQYSRLRNALKSWRLIRCLDDFGVLHRIGKLKTMENDVLFKHFKDLQIILTDNDLKYVDVFDLFSELIIF